jgi:sodium/bile acid cotransporter 7
MQSLRRHWFLTLLAIGFTAGYFAAERLGPLLEIPLLRDGVVFIVMFLMGVTLKAETIRASIARPTAGLIAIVINVLAVPLLTLPTMFFLPEKLFGGLWVAALVPCTLASASVWTRRAGGDDSVAMMTTVVTNLACVAVIPIGLAWMLTRSSDISAVDQIVKLSILVALPLIVAQVARRVGLAAWADQKKPVLSTIGQLGILVMVVFGAIASSQRINSSEMQGSGEVATSWLSMAMLIAAAATIHTLALFMGVAIARAAGITPARQIAVGIGGSQKTLMVGLQIAIDCGVSVVPMLVYHVGQLVIDTVIVDRWKRKHHDG